MPEGKGLLIVTMEPPPALEEEFNDWYDTEHVPERLGLPGFENALRFRCLDGFPRFLAMYDLTNVSALHTPEYQAVAGDKSSPWSLRMLARVRGLCRMEAVQVSPGDALLGAQGPCSRLAVLRFRGAPAAGDGAVVKGMRELFGAELAQLRAFRTADGDLIGAAELRGPAGIPRDLRPLGEAARLIDFANLYQPYFVRGRA